MLHHRSSKDNSWYEELTRYHVWVLVVATLGWLFDSLDQRLFVLARTPALQELIPGLSDSQVASYAAKATSIFILGWATGGLIFGLFGDRWGRVRTMMLTIIIYSVFTGLSAFSVGWWDFAFYRFCCGMGIGGEYAAGVALVAEVMPERARPYCLGFLQGSAALGHVAGSLVSLVIGPQSQFWGYSGWRCLFAFGVLPSLLVVLIRFRLREPESWQKAFQASRQAMRTDPTKLQPQDDFHKQLGDWREIFGNRQLAYHTVIGMALGVCGQIGLWGIGYWTPELIRGSQAELRQQQAEVVIGSNDQDLKTSKIKSKELSRLVDQSRHEAFRKADDKLVAWGTVLQDTAGMCGIFAFTLLTVRVGRRIAFALAYLLAFIATASVFGQLQTASQVYWMIPLLGFSISSIYGGYAIYFPELFPTRLRSTGTGICYNVARYVTAFGPLLLGHLTMLFAQRGASLPLREAAISLSAIYLLGLVFVYFAPETQGQPLPE